MFDRIVFRKFKRFAEQTIPLLSRGVSLIAGGNNCGKSSILHGLAVWEFCRAIIEAEKGPESFLPGSKHQGLGIGDDEFQPINVPSLRHLWTNLSPQRTEADHDGYTLRIGCTWASSGQVKKLEFGLSLANDRLFIKATDTNLTAGDAIPRVAYLPPFAGITSRETRVPLAIRRRRIGEGLAGSVLRNLLLDLYQDNLKKRSQLRTTRTKIKDADLESLRNTDPWELLQQAIRSTFGVELVVAPFKEEYHTHIKIEVAKGDLKGHRLTRHPGYKNRDLMVEGSGFLQWLSVYALATDPEVKVLLLDEPDAHLHPSLQQRMVAQLDSLADKMGKQVLIATHSTEILRQSQPERILEISTANPPRYLAGEHQKMGLLVGLGTDYTPRIDAVKRNKRVLFVEGNIDMKILQQLCINLGISWPERWVEWVSKAGHKERKHIFLALKEEITDLVAVSLRDRDDEPLGTVGERLEDKGLAGCPVDLHCKLWRRRNIESYLVWPPAIAETIGSTREHVDEVLRNQHAIAIGDTFPNRVCPEALCQLDGKVVLYKSFAVEPVEVAKRMPADKVPHDLKSLISELTELSR